MIFEQDRLIDFDYYTTFLSDFLGKLVWNYRITPRRIKISTHLTSAVCDLEFEDQQLQKEDRKSQKSKISILHGKASTHFLSIMVRENANCSILATVIEDATGYHGFNHLPLTNGSSRNIMNCLQLVSCCQIHQ